MSDFIPTSIANLLDFKDVVLSRLHGEELTSAVGKMKDVMKTYIELENDSNCSTDVLKKYLSEENEDIRSFEQLETFFAEKMKQEKAKNPVNVTSHQKWKLLEREIRENLGTSVENSQRLDLDDSQGNEEIAAVSETIQTLDPITKKVMQDPVKNTRCGHVYEKSSILEMIKGNHRFRCPQMGCVNKYPVRPDELVEDPELLRQIRRLLANKK